MPVVPLWWQFPLSFPAGLSVLPFLFWASAPAFPPPVVRSSFVDGGSKAFGRLMLALGLKAKGAAWQSMGDGNSGWVCSGQVRVIDIPVHEVKMKDFTAGLDRKGNSPKEVTDRKKIRAIFGVSVMH